jgi:hypothetical protein
MLTDPNSGPQLYAIPVSRPGPDGPSRAMRVAAARPWRADLPLPDGDWEVVTDRGLRLLEHATGPERDHWRSVAGQKPLREAQARQQVNEELTGVHKQQFALSQQSWDLEKRQSELYDAAEGYKVESRKHLGAAVGKSLFRGPWIALIIAKAALFASLGPIGWGVGAFLAIKPLMTVMSEVNNSKKMRSEYHKRTAAIRNTQQQLVNNKLYGEQLSRDAQMLQRNGIGNIMRAHKLNDQQQFASANHHKFANNIYAQAGIDPTTGQPVGAPLFNLHVAPGMNTAAAVDSEVAAIRQQTYRNNRPWIQGLLQDATVADSSGLTTFGPQQRAGDDLSGLAAQRLLLSSDRGQVWQDLASGKEVMLEPGKFVKLGEAGRSVMNNTIETLFGQSTTQQSKGPTVHATATVGTPSGGAPSRATPPQQFSLAAAAPRSNGRTL